MGNPSEEDDTQTKKSFADVVNEAVKTLKTGADGKYIFPEDMDDAVKFAVTTEKRLRDTQAEYTKSRQTAKALEAKNNLLVSKVKGNVSVKLTPEQTAELEELKFSDPEAWRAKVNKLEQEAATKQAQDLESEINSVSVSNLDKEELERRAHVLQEFTQANPDFELNDDIIANDIPPRITKKLETGQVTFEAFLQECYDYRKTGKVVKQDKVTNQPDLSKAGGGHTPDKNAVKEDTLLSYNKETY